MNTLHTSYLPVDADRALRRPHLAPDIGGPAVVTVRDGALVDLSRHAATLAELLDHPNCRRWPPRRGRAAGAGAGPAGPGTGHAATRHLLALATCRPSRPAA
jgi:fumarylacetoacetate (FAA) hydrolase family protein